MKIAVLGSGNGGCAVAFDCSAHGHDVRLFDFESFPETIRHVEAEGGIHAEGALEGFAEVAYAGHDLGTALEHVDLIYAVGPAFSTGPFAEACKPFLRAGQAVVVCPGSCMGSVVFKRHAGLNLHDSGVLVGETSTLPYAVRLTAPGRIRVFLKLQNGVFAAAVPSRETPRLVELMRGVYPSVVPGKNVLQTTLQNGNPVIHPAVSLLNAGLIERTKGDFLFYEEGVTPAVGRLMQAVDLERIEVGRALGLEVLSEPELGCVQGYMTEATYDRGYSDAPGFRGIGAQSRLDHRYILEDVGYGLVFLEDLAKQLGVAAPTISAVIRLASAALGRDFAGEAKRTMLSLGLADLSAQDLMRALA